MKMIDNHMTIAYNIYAKELFNIQLNREQQCYKSFKKFSAFHSLSHAHFVKFTINC